MDLRRSMSLLAAVLVILALAACGSSSKKTTSANTTGSTPTASSSAAPTTPVTTTPATKRSKSANTQPPALASAAASLSHCLIGHGVKVSAVAAERSSDPKVAAAFRACGGPKLRSSYVSSARARILKEVACVRRRGFHLPSPNLSGNGPVMPASVREDPKIRAALRACQRSLGG